ncbi:metal ABC transporter ATP-binding protein [Candidatus Acetothermia bacterium]|nr:metal ABC transporter ATP-binding protein [Candidatus Acetothermia bacterium]
MVQPVILVNGLSFSYPASPLVLEDVSLTVAGGSILGLVGPNGGGKTTLLKLILKLLPLQRGTIELFGRPVAQFDEWHRIGYLSQKMWSSDRNFPASVEEVVSSGRVQQRGLLRRLHASDRQTIQSALERVDMWAYQHRNIAQLSVGQQRRVFLARALASGAELLMLDEPTSSMDPGIQEDFYHLLEDLSKEQGVTIVQVSHDLAGATAHVTHVACLNRRLLYCGTIEEGLISDTLPQLYGEMRDTLLSELIAIRNSRASTPSVCG